MPCPAPFRQDVMPAELQDALSMLHQISQPEYIPHPAHYTSSSSITATRALGGQGNIIVIAPNTTPPRSSSGMVLQAAPTSAGPTHPTGGPLSGQQQATAYYSAM